MLLAKHLQPCAGRITCNFRQKRPQQVRRQNNRINRFIRARSKKVNVARHYITVSAVCQNNGLNKYIHIAFRYGRAYIAEPAVGIKTAPANIFRIIQTARKAGGGLLPPVERKRFVLILRAGKKRIGVIPFLILIFILRYYSHIHKKHRKNRKHTADQIERRDQLIR